MTDGFKTQNPICVYSPDAFRGDKNHRPALKLDLDGGFEQFQKKEERITAIV
jgi:hypothetical protein